MKIDLSQFFDTFLQESAEHLANIENGLLSLNTTPDDRDLLNAIFRGAHSIKGGAGAFGLTHVVHLTHALESLLDRMRMGETRATPACIELMLRATDVLKELIEKRDAPPPSDLPNLTRALEAAGGAPSTGSQQTGITAASEPTAAGSGPVPEDKDYRIVFKPAPDLFESGCNPLLVLRNLGHLGTVLQTTLDTSKLAALADLDTGRCYLSWEVIVRTARTAAELREVFEFVEDQAEIEVAPLTAAEAPAKRPLADSPGAQGSASGAREAASIRVATEKIDKVIDLVGEMVIAQAMTSQLVEQLPPQSHDRLRECVANMERCLRELHERTLSVRMLPVASLFVRFQRIVHDLSQKTGKNISLITAGDETEIDRSVLDNLSDPLMHLVRNSADHGIESPAERLAANKPEQGTIFLRAAHVAGSVVVEIQDDGGGLHLDRIREKALAKGLLAPDQEVSDDQIRALIFEPGFSTRSEVNDLSGRGVGMDVVKRNVTALNGTISVMSTEGVGTCVRILLPLTLAILDGLIVRVGSHHFVLPLISIVETLALAEAAILNVAGRGEAARIRDEALPLLRLRQLFHLAAVATGEDDHAGCHLAIVVESGTARAVLLVDELLGQQQVVVKNLEKNFRRIDGAMGATILGDGCAALILDVAALIQSAGRADRNTKTPGRMSLVA